VQNLLKLSLAVQSSGLAQFLFCSSIAVASNTPSHCIVAESPVEEFSLASKTGYAQSELVAEHVIAKAAADFHPSCHILCIGQIIGTCLIP
jgi:thioester reductase-like protein